MFLDHISDELSTAIRNALTTYRITQWGFVIFRCTYSSQEKWDKFLALLKEDVHNYFEWTATEDVYDSMAWTIIEDADKLDSADIVETSRRFKDWVGNQGKQEMQGSVLSDAWHYYPRYIFFIHVDEESLESVVDDVKARKEDGYFCKVVNANMVLLNEPERKIQDAKEDEDEDEDEVELRKHVKLDQVVLLFVTLLDLDSWFNI